MSLINENHALIQVEGLQKFYTRGNEKVVALRDVDLRVPAGEFIVIVGSSGSGKPTLLHLLGGIDGRYIVKYTLVLDTRTGPQSEILHEEISIDLTDINSLPDISFPKSCIDAKNTTPTPTD